MPRVISKPSSWATLIAQELEKEGRTPAGPGWQTFKELRAEVKAGKAQFARALSALVEKGHVEVFRGSRPGPSGMVRTCVWYRPTAA